MSTPVQPSAAPSARAAQQLAAPPTPGERSQLRAFFEVRGDIGGHQLPYVETELLAADGTVLGASYLEGPSPGAPAVLLAHGFGAHRRKPAYAYLADVLSHDAHVLSLDLRGHGTSAGRSTLGDLEALDVDAGVRWLRGLGHGCVVLVGLSMGGTSVVHAAAEGTPADAVVAVSTPARMRDEPETEAMRKLHRWWSSPVMRWVMATATNVRVVDPGSWRPPPHPAEAAARIDVPLLVVHGADDAYFPPGDADAIGAAAPRGTVWHEPAGFGHAEDGITPDFAVALARAVAVVASEGLFPSREAVSR